MIACEKIFVKSNDKNLGNQRPIVANLCEFKKLQKAKSKPKGLLNLEMNSCNILILNRLLDIRMARGHLPRWIPSITKYETNCLDTRMPKDQVLNMYNTVSAAPRGPHQLPVRRL